MTLLDGERLDVVNENITLIQKTNGLTFGTDALLIDHGKAVACGSAVEVLNKKHLDPVYGMDVGAWMRGLYGQWTEA